MSQGSPRIARKHYLDKEEPFVLPQSTAYWKKQRERSRPRDSGSQDAGVSAGTQGSSGDPSPSTCEPALTADGVSPNPHLGATYDSPSPDNNVDLSPEVVRPPQTDGHVVNDSFIDHIDADDGTCSEASEGDEHSSMDEIFSDCSDSFESDGDAEIGDESEEVRPTFLNESELLAEDFAHLETRTLPGSTTSKAAAVVMIMAFVITHGLSWVALDDLLLSQEQIPAESLAEVTEIADGAAHSGGRGGQLPEEDPSETSFRECSPGTQAKRRLAGGTNITVMKIMSDGGKAALRRIKTPTPSTRPRDLTLALTF
ncbi:hypothetical protein HPB52_000911 [Rhipicephalus sanguineus]|uniref:Uncharacterized protein n=1 Tax=Rhipicephalus sanguineus TaxID=34632 RepID=A0A9D4SVX6_RHISA|nr:hypothetical protein HPB52_000911 [Rhipicephalus sanguineus]